jgi:hypothetical protein
MAASNESYRIPGPVVLLVLGTLLTGAISFNVWAVSSVYERPTEDRVKEMIEDKSLFAKERSMILQALTDLRQANVELRKSLDRNTEEVAELKALIRTK